jgi:hypothetical protein
VRDAVTSLRLVPVMFELGARPRPVYRAYIAQSQVLAGSYWQSYGQVAPGEQICGLEDEYRLSAGMMPRLIYLKSPAPDREPRLTQLSAGPDPGRGRRLLPALLQTRRAAATGRAARRWKAGIAAAGDARAVRQARARQAEAEL